VLRLIHGGQYLARPLRFFNRYLIGVFLLNLLVFSGVIAVTTLAALLFRCLDLPWVMEWLNAIGFRDDVTRALAPSAVLFIAWLSAWVVSFWRDRSRAVGRVAQILAALLIV
jgi:hypothetical protein